ncbi:MAG: TMEM14 family protein [Planctomycetota bacterium]|nr:TMEM14 family protein [Planctomycetota bacterium]
MGQVVLVVYAVFLVVGGVAGFKKAGSKPSLIAGVASAALLLVALGISYAAPAHGLWAGAGVSLLLVFVFGVRLAKTGKFMPSGMLLALSAVALGLLAFCAWTTPVTP